MSLEKKLQLKNTTEIIVLNKPKEWGTILAGLGSTTLTLLETPPTTKTQLPILIFGTKLSDLETSLSQILPLTTGDAYIFVAYPKGTSKKYTSDFNRDTFFNLPVLEDNNFRAIRIISFDENWSCLRLRNKDYVKK